MRNLEIGIKDMGMNGKNIKDVDFHIVMENLEECLSPWLVRSKLAQCILFVNEICEMAEGEIDKHTAQDKKDTLRKLQTLKRTIARMEEKLTKDEQ